MVNEPKLQQGDKLFYLRDGNTRVGKLLVRKFNDGKIDNYVCSLDSFNDVYIDDAISIDRIIDSIYKTSIEKLILPTSIMHFQLKFCDNNLLNLFTKKLKAQFE